LTKTQCGDGTLEAVTKHAEIRVLILGGTNITDKGFAALKGWPATLQSLDLSDTQCGNAGLPHLARPGNLPNL
jgi:hypothetical protein